MPCLAARRRKGAPPARALANRTLPRCDTRRHDDGWRLSRAASVDGFVYDHRQPRPPAFQAQLPWRRPRPTAQGSSPRARPRGIAPQKGYRSQSYYCEQIDLQNKMSSSLVYASSCRVTTALTATAATNGRFRSNRASGSRARTGQNLRPPRGG